MDWKQTYFREEDPTDPSVPLAWVFERDERIVGELPPEQYGRYKKLVIGRETWFVHNSFAGALDLLFKALGEDNVIIIEGGDGWIRVPDSLKGSWIGVHGCVVGFLKNMLGLRSLRVVGVADWQRR